MREYMTQPFISNITGNMIYKAKTEFLYESHY